MKIREKDFLRAVKCADRRYYNEVRERIAEAALRKGERIMEQQEKKHITRKFVVGTLLAAAVLGGGGIAATVAMRGSGSIKSEFSYEQSSAAEVQQTEDIPELHLTPEGTYTWQNMHGLHASMFSGAYSWFAETDSGYYFEQSSYDEIWQIDAEDSDSYMSNAYNMRGYYAYKDKETGETVPLCARPNCLHDGNEYCVASTKAYYRSQLFSYENQLYKYIRFFFVCQAQFDALPAFF